EQVGALGHRASDQDAARAAALAGEPRRAGVALGDQVLGAGDEILPGVGLGLLLPGAVPLFAVFAATPHVRHRVDAAALEPRDRGGNELDVAAQAVCAVAGEQRGIRAVELDAALEYDRERDLDAVVPGHDHLDRLEAGQRVELADRVEPR